MTLLKKVLVRSDFVGVETQEKLTLKKAVEELYKELGEEKSIEISRKPFGNLAEGRRKRQRAVKRKVGGELENT